MMKYHWTRAIPVLTFAALAFAAFAFVAAAAGSFLLAVWLALPVVALLPPHATLNNAASIKAVPNFQAFIRCPPFDS